MIPNGKKIDWNGHNLTFESEPSQCRGCFFEDKNECPDCDEGVWVEDSPWHTGKPTEEGTYLAKMDNQFARWLVLDWDGIKWTVNGCNQIVNSGIIRWQKIEP